MRNILRKNLKGLESVLKTDKGLLVIAGLFIWGGERELEALRNEYDS